jgi:three-Cys-motif partner protein
MPTDPQLFFEEQKLASGYKHAILGKYLRPYAYKLGSKYKRVWVVDTHAGAGAYASGTGEAEAPGSPLVAARMARQIEHERGAPLLHTINVERDPKIFQRLEHALMPFHHLVRNLRGSFERRLDDVLAIVGHDPVLFFIDPFGMHGADIDLMERLLARPNRTVTELLIHFSDKGFQRMAGCLTAAARSDKARRAAETNVTELDRIVGSTWWRGSWKNDSLTTEEKCAEAAELYCRTLRRRVAHVHPIAMRDTWNGPVRYRLVFATQSPHGVEAMSEVVCGYERELFAAEQQARPSFDLEWEAQRLASLRGALREEIYAIGMAMETATLNQIVRRLAPRHFRQFRESDYRLCLEDLEKEAALERETPTGLSKATVRFLPRVQNDLFGAGQVPVGP